MEVKAESLFRDIQQAVTNDTLILPTLPEVALKIRDNIESDQCSIMDIANLLVQDAALSTSFIRIANSPLYRGIEKIIDLPTIVGRMGLRVVKDLVVSLALKQIFTATTPTLDAKFRSTWSTGVSVAAISRMLATNVRGISPEQALLAGLIHNIGVLPVLIMLEKQDIEINDTAELEQLLRTLQGPVGGMILKFWDFPDALQTVVLQCYNFNREHDGAADYADVVQVSLLQGGYVHLNGAGSPQNVQAFKKLNLDPDINIVEMDENQAIIEETKQQLM